MYTATTTNTTTTFSLCLTSLNFQLPQVKLVTAGEAGCPLWFLEQVFKGQVPAASKHLRTLDSEFILYIIF